VNKSLLIGGITALTAITAFSSAHADERWPRWYIGLSGGYTYMQDEDVSGAPSATSINPDGGFGLGGSIGYLPSSSIPLLNALRFEAEVSYHENNIDNISTYNGKVSGSGRYDSTAYMANAYYDLPIANSPWSPYIGAGAGVATIHLNSDSGVGNSGESDNEFAYQFLAGIGYSPSTIPNTQWTLGYRYLATTDPKFSSPTGDIKTQYDTNSFELGAKFRF
jgi:opacity protein-like surface antigen